MFLIRRLTIAFLASCALTLILSGLFSLFEDEKEAYDNRGIISFATNFGTEIYAHAEFINKLVLNKKINPKTKVRIFLDPYLIVGRGILISDPPNYYVFLDMSFYLSLNQDERKALVAHEIGHMVYEYSFLDKFEIRILYELGIFNKQRNEIITKYQVLADRFSAENSSPEAMISLLNKLYVTRIDNSDYKTRLESLKKPKQGQVP
ncbi:MAG TPA: hypothetical protein VJC06_02405 [Candidatus Paceibacterota bacterium]